MDKAALLVVISLLAVLAGGFPAAEARTAGRSAQDPGAGGSPSPGNNPVFVDTHLLPSPLTLPAGLLQIGTYTAYGVTGFLQVGTDLVSDALQIPNASAKIGLFNLPQFALALTAQWESYNYNNISSSNPDLRVNQWMPGAVAGVAVLPELAVFVGGNLNYTSVPTNSSIDTSGYIQGAGMESDVAWSYTPGYAVSAGATYDFTYKVYGVGLSHHWPGFQLGFHYYPNASDYQWRPIIAGGMAMNF